MAAAIEGGKTGQKKRSYYVYTLARPSTDEELPNQVFYVGKGTKSRIFKHEEAASKGEQSRKCNVIREIWAAGGQVRKTILYQTHSEQDALIYEWALMNMVYASDGLTNEQGTKPIRISRRTSSVFSQRGPYGKQRYVISPLWKEIRESLGLSQEGLARRTRGLSSRTIRNAESGQRVTFDSAIQILDALNSALSAAGKQHVTLDDLGLTLK